MTQKGMVPAAVLGLFETALPIIRALGRRAVPVFGYDTLRLCAWSSRYVKPTVCPDPASEEQFIDFLRSTVACGERHVLFVTSDAFLRPVARYREQLEEQFFVIGPRLDLLECIADKFIFHQKALSLGVPSPNSFSPASAAEIPAAAEQLSFPVFIKGRDALRWRAEFGPVRKGYTAAGPAELQRIAAECLGRNVPILIQELIPGPDTNHWKFCGYRAKDGRMLCSFTLQKIRQQPKGSGIGSCVVSRYNAQVRELGERLLNGTGYEGVGSAEFKLDERTGEYKLIELNPRFWQQNALPACCGIDFADTQYRDLLGETLSPRSFFREDVRWVNLHRDWESFCTYRSEGLLTFSAWLSSLRRPLVVSDLAADDPMPFLAAFETGRIRLRTAAGRLKSASAKLWRLPAPPAGQPR